MANNPQYDLIPFVDLKTGLVLREWRRVMDRIISAASSSDISLLQADINSIESAIASINATLAALAGAQQVGNAVLDFGAFPGSSFAMTSINGQPTISNSSALDAWIHCIPSVDHSADEHAGETIKVAATNVVPGAGFQIYGINDGIGDTRLYGQFNVSWSYQG